MEKQRGGVCASERPVTREDVQKILDYCGKCRTRMAMGLLVGVYGDLSLTELCALQWRDIDLETGMIHIRQAVRYEEALMDDGTKKRIMVIRRELRGTVTIHPGIRNLLRGWRKQSEEDGFLLRNGGPCDYMYVRQRFKNMMRRAGATAGNYRALCREFRRLCEEDGLYLDRSVLQLFYRMGNVELTLVEGVSGSEAAPLRGEAETEDHHAEIMEDSGSRSLTVMEARGKLPAAMPGVPGRTLTPYETLLILSRCMEHVTHTSLGLLVGVYADLQIAELCALRWRDIDLERDSIHVHHALVRVPSDGAKNKTRMILQPVRAGDRTLPVHPAVRPRLARWKEKMLPGHYVIRDENYYEPRTAARVIKGEDVFAGIPDFKCSMPAY